VRTPLILFTVYTWLGSMVRDDEPERPMTLSAKADWDAMKRRKGAISPAAP